MNFSNEETAKNFEATPGFEIDRHVGLISKFGSKLVSELTPGEAAALVDNGVNFIRRKAVEATPIVVPEVVLAQTAKPEKKSEDEPQTNNE